MSRTGLKLAVVGGLAVITGLLAIAPIGEAQSAAPKAYVGLFGDNTVGVIDSSTNKLIKTIPIAPGPHGLVITPDGKWVYASSDADSVVSIIDTATDTVATTIDAGSTPHGLAITPDGTRVLIAGFGSNQVEAIDTSTRRVMWQTPVLQPHNLAITADGQTAYAASQPQDAPSIVILEVATGTQTGSVPLDHTPRALNVSPDNQALVFTQAGVDSLQVLNRASNEIDTQIPTGVSPHHPLFTPDGKIGMVVAQGPGELDLFDPTTYTPIGGVKVGDMPHWIAATSDNHFAYVSNENSNDVSVVDLSNDTVTATIPVGKAPRKMVVQPGAVRMTTASQPAPQAKPTAAPQAPLPVTASPSANSVTIAKFAFAPATITISAGQSVTWTHSDAVNHTTTSDSGAWDSGSLGNGETFTTTLSQPGTYTYHCSIHPFMQGSVVVQ
jgi:YVTN family beta-propeller protein